MAEYQLYCFAQSGNAYKAALMLALTGADWEPVFVDFFNGETRTPDYRALNEMGEVPVLVHGELPAQPVRGDPRLSRRPHRPVRAARARPSGARSCAGRSGTTTSSRATSRPCAS